MKVPRYFYRSVDERIMLIIEFCFDVVRLRNNFQQKIDKIEKKHYNVYVCTNLMKTSFSCYCWYSEKNGGASQRGS